jgi:ATP-dependent helicase HrpB
VLTERGLGGDDVDLRHRLDQFRRDRSRRAEDARAMVRRWAVFPPQGEGRERESEEKHPGPLRGRPPPQGGR